MFSRFSSILLAFVLAIIVDVPLLAQRPAMHEINVVNDSVIDEGNVLYLHDKLSWVMSDAYKQMCSSKTASLSTVGLYSPVISVAVAVR